MSETNATVEIVRSVKQILLALIVTGGLSFVGYTYVTQPTANPAPVTPATDLATLIPDSSARAHVAAFYRDFAAVVAHPYVKTTGQFRTAQQIAVKIAQETLALPSLAPINEPISQRITAAIGLDDKQLDNQTRAALAACLTQISEDLQ